MTIDYIIGQSYRKNLNAKSLFSELSWHILGGKLNTHLPITRSTILVYSFYKG